MIVSEKRPEMSRIGLMILADLRSLVDKAVHMGHVALLVRAVVPWSSDMSRPSGLGYERRGRATSYPLVITPVPLMIAETVHRFPVHPESVHLFRDHDDDPTWGSGDPDPGAAAIRPRPSSGDPTCGDPPRPMRRSDPAQRCDPTCGDPTRSQRCDPTCGDPTRSQRCDPTCGDPTCGDPTRSQRRDPTWGGGDPTWGSGDPTRRGTQSRQIVSPPGRVGTGAPRATG
jgi:hypothetical protein